MELVAYLDESGTDDKNPFLIVAGFAADVLQWNKFNEELASLDQKFEAPPFHARIFGKAQHGHGPYACWSDNKRSEYIDRLLGIIGRRCFKSFGTLLEKAAYENIIRPHKAFREYFYSPFGFAAMHTIHAVGEWRNTSRPKAPLSFVVDKGNKNEGQLLEVAERTLLGPENNVKDIRVGDDTELPPLRAADLLAYELCAEGRNCSNPIRKFCRYSLDRLDDQPHEWLVIREENLLREIEVLLGSGTFRIEPSSRTARNCTPP